MIPDFSHKIGLIDVALSLPCWLFQFRKAKLNWANLILDYIMRKVWYHHIWNQTYLGFIIGAYFNRSSHSLDIFSTSLNLITFSNSLAFFCKVFCGRWGPKKRHRIVQPIHFQRIGTKMASKYHHFVISFHRSRTGGKLFFGVGGHSALSRDFTWT